MELAEQLQVYLSRDNDVRKLTEESLREERGQGPMEFLRDACDVVSDTQLSGHIRHLASRLIVSTLNNNKAEWKTLAVSKQNKICEEVLVSLGDEDADVRRGASSAMVALTEARLSDTDDYVWRNLVNSLLAALGEKYLPYRHGAVLTLGQLCEDIKPRHLSEKDTRALILGLLEQLRDPQLKAGVAEALMHGIAFARYSLHDDQHFGAQICVALLEQLDSEQDGEDMRAALWKAMEALAEHFPLALFDYAEPLYKMAVNQCVKAPESCGTIAVQTLSTLQSRDKANYKSEGYSIINKLSAEIISILSTGVQKVYEFELKQHTRVQFDQDTPEFACFEMLQSCREDAVALAGEPGTKQIIEIIHSMPESDDHILVMNLVSCILNERLSKQAQIFLDQGSQVFVDLLTRSNSHIEFYCLEKLFKKISQFYPQLAKNMENLKECFTFLKSAAAQTDLDRALLSVKMLRWLGIMSRSLGHNRFLLIMKQAITIGFSVLDQFNRPKSDFALLYEARDLLVECAQGLDPSKPAELRLLQTNFIARINYELLGTLEHLPKFTDFHQISLEIRMEIMAEAINRVEEVSDELARNVEHITHTVFNEKEVPISEGLLLLNSVLNFIEDPDCMNSIDKTIDGVFYALEQKGQIQLDSIMLLSTLGHFYGHKYSFFQRAVHALLRVLKDDGPTTRSLAAQVLGDFAIHGNQFFKCYVEQTLAFGKGSREQLIEYWKEEKHFSEQDHGIALQQFMAIMELYSCVIFASEPGEFIHLVERDVQNIVSFCLQGYEMLAVMLDLESPQLVLVCGKVLGQSMKLMPRLMRSLADEHEDLIRKIVARLGEELAKCEEAEQEQFLEVEKDLDFYLERALGAY